MPASDKLAMMRAEREEEMQSAAEKEKRLREALSLAEARETSRAITAKRIEGSFPVYWKVDCDADDAQSTEYPELEPALRTFFQTLIQNCSHKSGCDNDCNLSHFRDSELLSVRRDKAQWEVYSAKKRKLVRSLRQAPAGGKAGLPAPAVNPALQTGEVQEFLGRESWDPEAGDAFLFHGVPSEEAAFEIAERGFNGHLANSGGLFGCGCYFSDDFCKAAFYAMGDARKQDSSAVVLVCRVSLGHPFQVPLGQNFERDVRRPPRKCTCTRDCKCGEYYDSVVAHTNVINGKVTHGLHREIVVYDPDMVYPEFMLVFAPKFATRPPAARVTRKARLRVAASTDKKTAPVAPTAPTKPVLAAPAVTAAATVKTVLAPTSPPSPCAPAHNFVQYCGAVSNPFLHATDAPVCANRLTSCCLLSCPCD